MNSAGIGTVTPEMVRKRATELATADGRAARDVSENDLETARRELTGEPVLDPNQAALESMPESERWNPVPGSKGKKNPAAAGEDEDDDGRSDSARLVEQGIDEAELDHAKKSKRQ